MEQVAFGVTGTGGASRFAAAWQRKENVMAHSHVVAGAKSHSRPTRKFAKLARRPEGCARARPRRFPRDAEPCGVSLPDLSHCRLRAVPLVLGANVLPLLFPLAAGFALIGPLARARPLRDEPAARAGARCVLEARARRLPLALARRDRRARPVAGRDLPRLDRGRAGDLCGEFRLHAGGLDAGFHPAGAHHAGRLDADRSSATASASCSPCWC